jgi:hypothetical protein
VGAFSPFNRQAWFAFETADQASRARSAATDRAGRLRFPWQVAIARADSFSQIAPPGAVGKIPRGRTPVVAAVAAAAVRAAVAVAVWRRVWRRRGRAAACRWGRRRRSALAWR